ncbi:MAG: FIST C-terminal domain-containing protein [Ruminococcus sp.]|jgi:hypothetical protein|nr:FIST C-terminal domain-containing protein [Ruminococcus sp.]
MIKFYSAYTYQIDDEKSALEEILNQIDKSEKLLKNTVGIVLCHNEYAFSGAAAFIVKNLPFDVAGYTTTKEYAKTESNAGKNCDDLIADETEFRFELVIMTSDDVSFKVSVSEPNGGFETSEELLADCFLSPEPDDLKLVFTFLTGMAKFSGDSFVRAVKKYAPSVPAVGGFSVDDSPSYADDTFTIDNGGVYEDRCVLLKVYGNINPRFYSAVVTDSKIIGTSAFITETEGTKVLKINDRPVTEYLVKSGLINSVHSDSLSANLSFLIREKHADYCRVLMNMTADEKLNLGGEVPVGSEFRLAIFEAEDILKATTETVKAAASEFCDSDSGVIIFSCQSRCVLMGDEPFRGIQAVCEAVESLPLVMTYAGGEVGPIKKTENSKSYYSNQFHNQTFVMCVL